MHGNVSKLLWSFFERYPIEGWNEGQNIFRRGRLPVKDPVDRGEVMHMKNYSSNKWSNKLQVRKTGKAYFDEEVEERRNEGILLHQILSEIIHYQDTSNVLDRYERGMQITKEDRDRYETIISNLWKDEQVKSWFNGIGEVKTEVIVLPKDGETKRMDRVVLDGNEATVIDFKSGKPKAADSNQLKAYISLLAEMGYEVKGYLLYLSSGEVVSS